METKRKKVKDCQRIYLAVPNYGGNGLYAIKGSAEFSLAACGGDLTDDFCNKIKAKGFLIEDFLEIKLRCAKDVGTMPIIYYWCEHWERIDYNDDDAKSKYVRDCSYQNIQEEIDVELKSAESKRVLLNMLKKIGIPFDLKGALFGSIRYGYNSFFLERGYADCLRELNGNGVLKKEQKEAIDEALKAINKIWDDNPDDTGEIK